MKKDKIEKIEDKLSELLKNKSIDDYLDIINNNQYLKKYDQIMAKIDNGEYPTTYLKK